MLNAADHVIAPDADVANRIWKHFPELHVEIRPHELLGRPARKVLLLGHLVGIKGSNIAVETARAARDANLPLEFHLLGSSDREDDLRALGNVRLWGPYQANMVQSKIAAIGADLVWLSSVIPETFSYTLSEALAAGLFIVGFDLGAIANRIRACGPQAGAVVPLALADDPCEMALRLANMALGSPLPAPNIPRIAAATVGTTL
jgi:glycosyltransferase involved in cell wall biosynthesis